MKNKYFQRNGKKNMNMNITDTTGYKTFKESQHITYEEDLVSQREEQKLSSRNV
jgi:hypothetical protein